MLQKLTQVIYVKTLSLKLFKITSQKTAYCVNQLRLNIMLISHDGAVSQS